MIARILPGWMLPAFLKPTDQPAATGAAPALGNHDENEDGDFEGGFLLVGPIQPGEVKHEKQNTAVSPPPAATSLALAVTNPLGQTPPVNDAKQDSESESLAGNPSAPALLRVRSTPEGSALPAQPASVDASFPSLTFTSTMQPTPERGSPSESDELTAPLLGARARPRAVPSPATPYRFLSDGSYYVGVFSGTLWSGIKHMPLLFQVPGAGVMSAFGAELLLAYTKANHAAVNREQARKDMLFNAVGTATATTALQYLVAGSVSFWVVPVTLVTAKIVLPRVQPFAANMASWWQGKARTDSNRKKFDLERQASATQQAGDTQPAHTLQH